MTKKEQLQKLLDVEREKRRENLQSQFEEKEKATRFYFGCAFFILFVAAAIAFKLLVLNALITGVPNIILTCLLFLVAIVLPFLVSGYRARLVTACYLCDYAYNPCVS